MIAYLRRALAGYPRGLSRDQDCLDRLYNTVSALAEANKYPQYGTVIHPDDMQLINNVLDYCEEVGYQKRRHG